MNNLNVKLKEALEIRGMTQLELAERTGLKPSTISELANNKRSAINRQYIVTVANALGIDDIRDIIDFSD